MTREVLAWIIAIGASGVAIACWVTARRFKTMLKDSLSQQVETLKRRWAVESELARLKGINLVEDAKTLDERTARLNDLLARLK